MNSSDARALLDVGVDADPDEVRRAYLRACRRHRPETDPEGFQRVRAAYEVLRSGDPFGDDEADVATPAPEAVPAAAPTPDLAPRLAWLGALEPEALLDHEPIERLEACATEAVAGLAVHVGAGTSRDVGSLVMLVLALWARGRTTGAQLLLSALRREPLSGLGAAGALLPLLREVELLGEFRTSLASAVAEALVRQDDAPVARWLRGEEASERSLCRELLVHHAPSLATRFGRVLDAHAPRGDGGWDAPSPLYWIVALVGMVGLATGRVTCTRESPPVRPTLSTASLFPSPREEWKILCDVSRAACDRHEALSRALARGDCAAALTDWRVLDALAYPNPVLRSVRARFVERCGPIPLATTTDPAPTAPTMTAPPPSARDGAP